MQAWRQNVEDLRWACPRRRSGVWRRGEIVKVARLQSEFCTKDFFRATNFLRKMLRNFPRKFWAFVLWVRKKKKTGKFPPNFPLNFPNFPAKIKKNSPTSFCRSAGRRNRQGVRLQCLPARPHSKHIWNIPSHNLLQTNYCSQNSRNNAIVLQPLRAIASHELLHELLRQQTTIAATPLAGSTPSPNSQVDEWSVERIIRSERLQNESSLNFSNFLVLNFPPNSAQSVERVCLIRALFSKTYLSWPVLKILRHSNPTHFLLLAAESWPTILGIVRFASLCRYPNFGKGPSCTKILRRVWVNSVPGLNSLRR